MYLGLFLKNNYSPNLSKIDLMLLAISAVYISDFEKAFACKETSYFKASNLDK